MQGLDEEKVMALTNKLFTSSAYHTLKANVRPMSRTLQLTPLHLAGVLLRAAGCFASYLVINSQQLPPFLFAFYVYCFAALFYLVKGSGLAWTSGLRKNFLYVVVHAGWQVNSFILWATAVLMLHPIQAVLAEYTEYLFLALVTEQTNRSSGMNPTRRRGMVMKFLASLALLTTAHAWYEEPHWVPKGGVIPPLEPGHSKYGGLFLMILYCLSEAMRKTFKAWLGKSVPMKSVTVCSHMLSPILLAPFLVLYSGFAPHTWVASKSLAQFAMLAGTAGLVTVLPSVLIGRIEAEVGQAHGGAPPPAPSRLLACSFGCGYVMHLLLVFTPSGATWWSLFCYHVCLAGAFVLMLAAVNTAHGLIARGYEPQIIDPFAEYDMPEIEHIDTSFLGTITRSASSKKLLVFLLLNVFYMVVEFLYGAYSGSLGLISDSFHMALDSLAVAIALYASYVATLPPTAAFTYGYGRCEVLSGYTNGILLLCIAMYVFIEALGRLIDPPEIDGEWLLSVSVGGLVINVIGVVFFHEAHHVGSSNRDCPVSHGGCSGGGHSHGHSHSHGDAAKGSGSVGSGMMNLRGVYLHILADLVGSLGVIVSSALVRWTGYHIADPVCSIFIAGLISASALPLLKDTALVLMQGLTNQQEAALDECLEAADRHPAVGKVVHASFWQHTPGAPMGTVRVAAATRAHEATLLATVQDLFAPLAKAPCLTVEVNKAL
eukprot:TRINITY_DN2653_c3_g1_i2.p1 TRINITY_DN2653_c3_g1~~TRINITY_DN2653_c3_g1_i2.p1  ORF type:complete len:757 (+),score=201.18 TRINITY_DN2653_c3_g1_i2:131-2272(+)